jgi:hypothetical protein
MTEEHKLLLRMARGSLKLNLIWLLALFACSLNQGKNWYDGHVLDLFVIETVADTPISFWGL